MSAAAYTVKQARVVPDMKGEWESPAWLQAETAWIDHWRAEGTEHRPQTGVRLLSSQAGIHGFFRVEDRYVRCVNTKFQEPVWKDSCVEFFVQPKADKGYFNFEFNCGGALLASYVTDPTRTPAGLARAEKLPPALGERVLVYHSMPATVEPEIRDPTLWLLQFFIPFAVLEDSVGPVTPLSGGRWRANFYKCGDATSHPHWGSWCPVDQKNFHLPRCFGELAFE